MRRLLIGAGITVALLVALVVAHVVAIEHAGEVIVLRTQAPDGGVEETRLWAVDDAEGHAWLHGNPESGWMHRLAAEPRVEVERDGQARAYRAVPVPGPHPEIDRLLREKYGAVDRWVRFIAPDGADTTPVRLDPL